MHQSHLTPLFMLQCVPGKFQQATGAQLCSMCPSGTLSNSTQAPTCRSCVAGDTLFILACHSSTLNPHVCCLCGCVLQATTHSLLVHKAPLCAHSVWLAHSHRHWLH